MGTKEEIAEMFDALERTVEDEPTTSEDQPPEDKPSDETPPEAPATSAPSDESTQSDQDAAPATDAPKDPVEDLRRENEELRKKMEELSKPKEAAVPPPPATEPPISDQDFLKDVDVDDLVSDRDSLNKLLNNVYKQALKDANTAIKRTSETVLTTVPDRVIQGMELKESLRKLSEQFYDQNKDLKPFSKVVGVVFDELIQQSPKATYNEVLGKLGEETRKRLELKKPEATTEPDPKPSNSKDSPPPLPRKKGGRVSKPATDSNPLASEIDAMNRVVRQ
jgi:hypothetical protein